MKVIRQLIWAPLLLALCGCAATQIALEKKDLNVQTKMSDTIFLDVEARIQKTVFVDIKNTSDKDINLKPAIIAHLQSRGYTIVQNPRKAFYILQGNVLYVGKADPSALRKSIYAGYGGAIAGGAAGALIGAAANNSSGAWIGGGIGTLVGGAAEMIAGSLVKDVTYTVVTDIMISEKSSQPVKQTVNANLKQSKGSRIVQTSSKMTKRMRYQTRVGSYAEKVNLKFEEALPVIIENQAKSISGIF